MCLLRKAKFLVVIVAWLLNAIERFNFESPPLVTILSLGSGNDLSRALQWGVDFLIIYAWGGLTILLHDVNNVTVMKLGHWKVNIKEQNGHVESTKMQSKFMMNYLSV